MSVDATIEHRGRVSAITATGLEVSINSQSACAACHAKSACTSLDSRNRLLSITCPTVGYSVGDEVRVLMTAQTGYRALFYGYVLPLMVVLVVLFSLSAMGLGEATAGLAAIGTLIPYYIGLRQLRKRMAQRIMLHVERIQ